MNKLFLHEAYKDKTDEELIALRKSHFQFTSDSDIMIGDAQYYHDFLCLPPGTDWTKDSEDTDKLYDKISDVCKKLSYWDDERYPDVPRWTAVHGLIEILNDYPEITTTNIDFEHFLGGDHFDNDVLNIIHGIHDDAKRLEFATFFFKHFNLFTYKDCFLNDKGKSDSMYIKKFKEKLRYEIDQIKKEIKPQTPPKSPKTTCPAEYTITIEDLVTYAYSDEGKDIRDRLNPVLRYLTTEKGWKWDKVNQQIEKAKKKLGIGGTVNINNPTIQELYMGDKVNHKN